MSSEQSYNNSFQIRYWHCGLQGRLYPNYFTHRYVITIRITIRIKHESPHAYSDIYFGHLVWHICLNVYKNYNKLGLFNKEITHWSSKSHFREKIFISKRSSWLFNYFRRLKFCMRIDNFDPRRVVNIFVVLNTGYEHR